MAIDIERGAEPYQRIHQRGMATPRITAAELAASHWTADPGECFALVMISNRRRTSASIKAPQQPAEAHDDRCGQNLTHAPQQTPLLFDHLVGEQKEIGWHFEAVRFGDLEVDDEFDRTLEASRF